MAIHMASLMGRTSAVQILLSHGANVNGTYRIGIDAPLPVGHSGRVQHGQMFTPKITPLDMASMQGHLGVVKVLLEHGADASEALKYARGNRHSDVVEALLSYMKANEGLMIA